MQRTSLSGGISDATGFDFGAYAEIGRGLTVRDSLASWLDKISNILYGFIH